MTPDVGLFKVGEEVEWGTTVRGSVRRLRGTIYAVVPAGVKPAPPAPSRQGDGAFTGDDTRDHESYIVRAVVDGAARFYWPRVSALAATAPRQMTTDHDRAALRAAERHALEVTARECDAAKTAIAYQVGVRVQPVTRYLEDGRLEVKLWDDRRHPFGGVVQVVRRHHEGDAEVVAVYFARDHHGPDRLDWLELAGLRAVTA